MNAMLDGMLLTAFAIVVGVALGLLRGGSLRAILGSPLRYWPVLIVGAVLHTVSEQVDIPGRLSVFVIASFLLVVSALLNVHLKGAVVSGIGITLNLAAVVANGHVPIRLDALIAAGEVEPGIDPSQVTINGGLWALENGDTSLRQLGDIIPIPFLSDVVSFGDLILIGGLTVLSMNLVLHRRRVGVELDDLLDDNLLEEVPEEAPENNLPESGVPESGAGVDVRDVLNLEAPTPQTDNAEPASAQS